ncbi:unnamed protein product, partial [Symbiodinium necroappetens]
LDPGGCPELVQDEGKYVVTTDEGWEFQTLEDATLATLAYNRRVLQDNAEKFQHNKQLTEGRSFQPQYGPVKQLAGYDSMAAQRGACGEAYQGAGALGSEAAVGLQSWAKRTAVTASRQLCSQNNRFFPKWEEGTPTAENSVSPVPGIYPVDIWHIFINEMCTKNYEEWQPPADPKDLLGEEWEERRNGIFDREGHSLIFKELPSRKRRRSPDQ